MEPRKNVDEVFLTGLWVLFPLALPWPLLGQVKYLLLTSPRDLWYNMRQGLYVYVFFALGWWLLSRFRCRCPLAAASRPRQAVMNRISLLPAALLALVRYHICSCSTTTSSRSFGSLYCMSRDT